MTTTREPDNAQGTHFARLGTRSGATIEGRFVPRRPVADAGGHVPPTTPPARLVDGIAPSDDPILRVRSHAYAESTRRRSGAECPVHLR